MEEIDVENLISRIAIGGRFAEVTRDGESCFVFIKNLSMKDKTFISFIYDNAYKKARDNGLYSENELKKIYDRSGLWTKEDEEKFIGIEKDLIKIEEGMKDIDKDDEKNIRTAKRVKNAAENTWQKYALRRNSLFSNSAERMANEAKINAIIFSSAHIAGNKIWPTWSAFETETDEELIASIRREIMSIGKKITTSEFRKIARSPSWRFRWGAAQKIGDLFGCPVIELDDDQQNLLYWSQFYDSIFEAYERPPDSVIDDDAKLDEWLIKQGEKNKQEQNKRAVESGYGPVSKNIGKHGEIFIMANPSTMHWEEGVLAKPLEVKTPEEIFNLNDPDGKKFIKIHQDKVKKHGMVDEKTLRGDIGSRHMIGAKQAGISIDREGKKHTNWTKNY